MSNPAPKRLSTTSLYDRTAVIETVRLIVPAGNVTEVRVLEATTASERRPHTESGYFNDPVLLADALSVVRSAKGFYLVLNPIDAALLARAMNRLRPTPKGESTADTNITRRLWLPVDADPLRVSGVSATDAEHEAAIQRARDVYAFLKSLGWPDPIAADSSNGGHLLYRIDLDAQDGGLVQRCLQALAGRFDDAAVKIDTSVHNPARIWKLYGTVSAKGDNTPDRPHRMSKILARPPEMRVVPVELLEPLASVVAPEPTSRCRILGNGAPTDAYDLEAFIARHGLDVDGPHDWNGKQGPGKSWSFNTSPMCDHHGDGPYVVQHASGAITAGCHHDSCNWGWQELRAHLEPVREGAFRVVRAEDSTNDTSKKSSSSDSKPFSSRDTDDPWPSPLAPEAFHGLVGDIVHLIEPHSEADPAAILIQLLTGFGNLIGRNAHFRTEGDYHPGKLFNCLVGPSSKGRKGTSWGQVSRLLALADPVWAETRVLSGLSSGEGLIWQVRDALYKKEPIREKAGKGRNRGKIIGYEDVLAVEGVDDKRLLVLESEMGNLLRVLRRESNTLSPIVRDAWDKANLRTLTKNSPAVSSGCHISIIGHITRTELRRHLTETDMANGFANRFIWFCVRRSKCLPEGGNLNVEQHVELIERLRHVTSVAKACGEVRRDAAAAAVWGEVYEKLSEGHPGLLGAITSRAEAQTMRLALLYALMDGSTVIREEHLLAALAVWDYAEASAKHIFGSALGDPTADEILRALRAAGANGMTRTELSKHFQRNRGSAEIARALRVLEESGLARCAKIATGEQGRPEERWFAI